MSAKRKCNWHTLEDVLYSTKRYTSFDQWANNEKEAFELMNKNTWQCYVAKETGWPVVAFRTFEDVIKTTKGFKSYRNWYLENPGAYRAARKNKWLDRLFEEKGWFRNQQKITFEQILKTTENYKDYKTWKANETKAYWIIFNNKWYDRLIEATGWSGKKYNLEDVLENSSKYNSYKEWRLEEPAMYRFASDYNWQDEVIKYNGWKKQTRTYCYEDILKTTKGFKSYSEWKSVHTNLYNTTNRRKWKEQLLKDTGWSTKGLRSLKGA